MGRSEKQQRELIDIFTFFLGPFRSLALILIGLFIGGIALALCLQEILHRELVEVSLKEYLEMDERPKYVKLTGCALNLEEACWKTSAVTGNPDFAYIPLRPAGASGEEPIRIVVASKVKLSLVMKLIELEKTPEARRTYIEDYKIEMHPTADITGWASQSSTAYDLFQKNGVKISPTAWVIVEGKTPSPVGTLVIVLFCGVLIFLGVGGLYFFVTRAE